MVISEEGLKSPQANEKSISYEDEGRFEPSMFANKVHSKFKQLTSQIVSKSSSDKEKLNLCKNDQVHYPHFKPHIFLVEDIAENILETMKMTKKSLNEKKAEVNYFFSY